MAGQLDIRALTDPGGIRVAGEVDVVTLPQWELALDAVRDGSGDAVVDLGGLAFIDVGGLRALAVAALSVRSRVCRLTLRGAAPSVRRFLDLLGWSELFVFDQCLSVRCGRPETWPPGTVAARNRGRPEAWPPGTVAAPRGSGPCRLSGQERQTVGPPAVAGTPADGPDRA